MSNNKYRLLVVDIDGTLLSGLGVISEHDRRALARVRRLGVLVSLSTGRALQGCQTIIKDLGLDGYHVSFDGALVSTADLGEEVYAGPLSPGLVEEMVEFAHELGTNLELYTATRYLTERESWSSRAHEEFFGMGGTLVDFDGVWERERIIKGGLVVRTSEEAEKARAYFDHFAGRLHVSGARTPAYPGTVFNNLLAAEVSKGSAAQKLAAYLGLNMDEVMAIGDGSNDVSLLKAVGLGVAMGSASEEVKAAAEYVTLDVEHAGVAVAVERFLG